MLGKVSETLQNEMAKWLIYQSVGTIRMKMLAAEFSVLFS